MTRPLSLVGMTFLRTGRGYLFAGLFGFFSLHPSGTVDEEDTKASKTASKPGENADVATRDYIRKLEDENRLLKFKIEVLVDMVRVCLRGGFV